MDTSIPTRQPNRYRTTRRRLYAHTWTTAAGLAALALTVLETAGIRNP